MTNKPLVKLPKAGAVHDIIDRLADSFVATYGENALEYVGWLTAEIERKLSVYKLGKPR